MMKKVGFLMVLAVMGFVGWYIWMAGDQTALLIESGAYYIPCAVMVICSICNHRFDWILALPSIGAAQVISQIFFLKQPQVMAWTYLIICTLWCMRCLFGGQHDTVVEVFHGDDWSLNDMSGDEWD